MNRGFPVMQALKARASATEYNSRKLELQDLSDLLWAANGVNRPENGKRTAPSAINAQDIDVYACMEQGTYLYNAEKHVLTLIASGDQRALIAGKQANVTKAPVICLLVSDVSRFSSGADSVRLRWAAMDAGIVSENISLFCAAVGFSTRPRAQMDLAKLREVLKLKPSQHPILNNPVSYKPEPTPAPEKKQ
jgi:SagB-type dehydrogenase family enzyme